MSEIQYLTQAGYDKISNELEHLKTVGRQEAAQAIAEAREKGDLSENAEYDAAKDAQGMLEMKINHLEKTFANARIINEEDIDISKVGLLTVVTIKNIKMNKEMTFKLVSESEANLKEKKLSISSPIGGGILGKKVGETAKVATPAGTTEFEIIKIALS